LTSDIRLKENIQNIPNNAIDNLVNLQSKQYTFINDPLKKIHYGYIAQDFEQLYPSLIATNADEIKAINYIELIPLLVEKINRLELEISEYIIYMKNLFYDSYLPNISASMIFALSTVSIVMPYIYSAKKKLLKHKHSRYEPNIPKEVWTPILFFLSITIFLYMFFLLRHYNDIFVDGLKVSIKSICLFIIGFSLIYTIFGVMQMMYYIERAYNMWNFKAFMGTLCFLSLLNITLSERTKNTILYIYTLICITLVVLILLLSKEFRYYIINKYIYQIFSY
jgi:hypothetical protein